MSYANMTNEEILAEKLEIAWSKINQLERERDEAMAKVENQRQRIKYLEGATNHACGTPLTLMRKERDELRAEVERLKAQSCEQNRCMNQLRELWKHLSNIENKYDERLAYHLDELIERLKADKARMDWLGICSNHNLLFYFVLGKCWMNCTKTLHESRETLREAIDAAMKGAE